VVLELAPLVLGQSDVFLHLESGSCRIGYIGSVLLAEDLPRALGALVGVGG